MVQENRLVGDPAKQVEPEITPFFGQGCIDFHRRPFEYAFEKLRATRSSRRILSQRGNEIVTAQRNDYTGQEHAGRNEVLVVANPYLGRFDHAHQYCIFDGADYP